MNRTPLAAGAPPAAAPCAGYTRVSAQALTGTARAAAASEFGVDPAVVRAFLRDDAGYLALVIQLPVALVDTDGGFRGTVMEQVRERRALIAERFTALTGSMVSRVDVRVTGIVERAAGGRR